MHDFALFKGSKRARSKDVLYSTDLGYVGIVKFHARSEHPYKKPRNKQLNDGQKDFNRVLSSIRIAVEHVNAWLKRFRILYQKYRGRIKNFWKAMLFACAMFNRSFVHV